MKDKLVRIDNGCGYTGITFVPTKEDDNCFWMNDYYSFGKNNCTVITELDKEEPKNEYARQLRLLSELKNTISPLVEALNKSKALPHEIPAPEPKGYCIKRTPENAEVLNKWHNEHNTVTTDGQTGYMISIKNPMNERIQFTIVSGCEEDLIELFTVEEFFEKVGYNPEPDTLIPDLEGLRKIKESISEPVLIAKAGVEALKIAESVNPKLKENEKSFFIAGFQECIKWQQSGIKFEKVVEEPVKEESERIPFDLKLLESGKYDVVCDNGRMIESLTRNDRMEYPLFGVDTGINEVKCWTLTGHYYSDKSVSDYNLFIIPKKETVWVNVYHGNPHKSKDIASFESKHGSEYKIHVETIEVKRPIK